MLDGICDTTVPGPSPTFRPTPFPTAPPPSTHPTGAPTLGPTPSTCNDGVRNGQETDVDCGGYECHGCFAGRNCTQGIDCMSGLCIDEAGGMCSEGEHCVCNTPSPSPAPTPAPTFDPTATPSASPTPQQCKDRRKNGDEVDVDCGGTQCPPCQTGSACLVESDCTSGVCTILTKDMFDYIDELHCGARPLYYWQDGTDALHCRTDKTIAQCKAICRNRPECSGFVLKKGKECCWVTGPPYPFASPVYGRYHCYKKGATIGK